MVWRCVFSTEAVGSRSGGSRLASEFELMDIAQHHNRKLAGAFYSFLQGFGAASRSKPTIIQLVNHIRT